MPGERVLSDIRWYGGGYVISPYNDAEISKALCEKNHQQAFRDQLAQ